MTEPPTEPFPPRNPVRYWRHKGPGGLQNFGDYLTELFLAEMLALPRCPADAFHLIGSVIHEPRLYRTLGEVGADPATAKVAFWGCGLRSETPLSAVARERCVFLGVRGPLTRDVLGLPADTVLGDPGLLLPLLQPAPRQRPGRTVSTGEQLTGARSACESNWGANDMIGNVHEWVADWIHGDGNDWPLPIASNPTGSDYGDDNIIANPATVQSGAGATLTTFPAAVHRGGRATAGDRAGVFAFFTDFAPSAASGTIGFRCAR